jgi:hypothetical protein
MKFNSKVTIPLGAEEKNYIQKKATENRQTVSGYVRSKMFECNDLRKENELIY